VSSRRASRPRRSSRLERAAEVVAQKLTAAQRLQHVQQVILDPLDELIEDLERVTVDSGAVRDVASPGGLAADGERGALRYQRGPGTRREGEDQEPALVEPGCCASRWRRSNDFRARRPRGRFRFRGWRNNGVGWSASLAIPVVVVLPRIRTRVRAHLCVVSARYGLRISIQCSPDGGRTAGRQRRHGSPCTFSAHDF
jgi:hypothetical protein